ncbi:MAG: hypothetical protein AMXMBFR12_03140 [Candidatus Babeliales bacterium]
MDFLALPITHKKLIPKTQQATNLYALAWQYIANKQDLNAPVQNDRPLLITAALSDEHLATAWLLLLHGANPDVKDSLGKTPLLYAAQACAHRIIGTLLYFKANPNHSCYQQSQDRQTPLHALCTPTQDSFDAKKIKARQQSVEWLLAAGADANAQDFLGNTSSFGLVACYYGNKVSALLTPQEKKIFHDTRKQLIDTFLANKANLDKTNTQGNTLFFQRINWVDPYLNIYTAFSHNKRRAKLCKILLAFLKTNQKPEAKSPFKSMPPDILRYILKLAYPYKT